MEDQDQYLKRIAGLQRLYSAILITKSKRNQAHQPHPHGLENGWIWLSNFLMLDPLPGISPTLMVEFFQICGADMSQAYRGQFMKLIAILYAQYMPRLDQVRMHFFSNRNRLKFVLKKKMIVISTDRYGRTSFTA